jgi:hypothetical protein
MQGTVQVADCPAVSVEILVALGTAQGIGGSEAPAKGSPGPGILGLTALAQKILDAFLTEIQAIDPRSSRAEEARQPR